MLLQPDKYHHLFSFITCLYSNACFTEGMFYIHCKLICTLIDKLQIKFEQGMVSL